MNSLILVVLVAVALFGRHQSKQRKSWGMPLAAIAAIGALIIAVVGVIPKSPSLNELGSREVGFAYSRGYGLGEHVASAFPNSRATVAVRATMTESDSFRGLQDALAKGKVELTVKEFGSLPDADREGPPPADSMVSGDDDPTSLRDFLDEKDADVLVLLAQPSTRWMSSWEKREQDRPKLVVLANTPESLIEHVESGVIAGALISRPDARLHDKKGRMIKPPSDPSKAFLQAYQVLTAENVQQHTQQFPYLYQD